jgi:hypothetical protein
MRFDTHRVSAFLVEEVQRARPSMEVVDDGGDIIHIVLASGEVIYVYLIESPITVYEIRGIVETNSAAGCASLFILWCDLFLPVAGSRYHPDDWMATLLALGDDLIYGFDPYGGDTLIFPVYFDGGGRERLIRHGGPIHVNRLNCKWTTKPVFTPFAGERWHMADFEVHNAAGRRAELPRHLDPLHASYALLGVPRQAHPETIKRAYRRLARRYHPDLSPGPGATELMQQINDAYARIMRQWGDRL